MRGWAPSILPYLLAWSRRPRQVHSASYRIADNLARPNLDDLIYFEKELSVGRLNTLVEWLWVAGQPMPLRPLHHQLLLDRDVVIAEQMDLHLVWTPGRIFLKPLPPFLLEPRFWRDQLACKIGCDCSYDSGERGYIWECARRKLWRCALGFLFSYAGLICYESGFWIAKEKHLLPHQVEWVAWRDFIWELNTEHIYDKVDNAISLRWAPSRPAQHTVPPFARRRPARLPVILVAIRRLLLRQPRILYHPFVRSETVDAIDIAASCFSRKAACLDGCIRME